MCAQSEIENPTNVEKSRISRFLVSISQKPEKFATVGRFFTIVRIEHIEELLTAREMAPLFGGARESRA